MRPRGAQVRRIERATQEDLAIRSLAVDQHPDHDPIAAFWQEHLANLWELFVQVLLSVPRKLAGDTR